MHRLMTLSVTTMIVLLPQIAWADLYASPEVSCPPTAPKAIVQQYDALDAMPEPIWRAIARILDPEIPEDNLANELPHIVAPRNAEWQVSDVTLTMAKIYSRIFG